jgi:DNA-directed RNA polymerase
MIVPPLDWRQGQVGGYHTGAKLRNYSLVTPKYRFDPNAWKAADEAIQGDNTKRTLDAVNAMQRTSWRINQPALQIGKKLNDGCVPGAENKKLAKERTLNAAERFKNFDCVIRSIATPDSGRRRPGSGTH